jgi:hypothetical protein
MAKLDGTWIYRSFRPNGSTPPLVPWAPPGELSVTTDAAGKVQGKLIFPAVPGLELAVRGSVTLTVEGKLPEGVELTGEGGRGSVNELRGYFVAGSAGPVLVGTITAVRNNPAGQSDGTSGPFVLLPPADV